MSCDKLILYYEPLSLDNKTCTTDLTPLSDNCIQKLLVQKNVPYYDKHNKLVGSFDSSENHVIYEASPYIKFITSEILFTINICSRKEMYSVNLVTENVLPVKANSVLILKFNLTSVQGEKTFKKLKWTLETKDGVPQKRTLVFYS